MTLRVTHISDGLAVGGAEMMLRRLIRATADRYRHDVVSLTDVGPVGQAIAEDGVPVRALDLRPRAADVPVAVARLVGLMASLRRERPDVVQTWLYQADLVGGLGGRLAGVPVVWGIHRFDLDPSRTKRRMRATASLGALASRALPDRIVCCSQSAADVHTALGYRADRIVVIPNGFELPPLPRPDVTAAVRSELRIPPEACVVGLVARWDPQKDHRTFAKAAGLVAARRPDTWFVLCGAGIDDGNAQLRGWLRAEDVEHRTLLLGLRDDVERLHAAMDVAVSSSAGEAFPLAIGEAMALGVPCVVTDVGDAIRLVGETGRVVPPGDPDGLATAITEVLALPPRFRHALGEAGRRRIEERFSLSAVAARYGEVWEQAAARRPRAAKTG